MFNPHSRAGLAWGQELWKWDITCYEGAAGIAAALTALGRAFDDDDVLFRAIQNVLQDFIDAAGGVELAHKRFQNSLSAAQATYEEMQTKLPPRPSTSIRLRPPEVYVGQAADLQSCASNNLPNQLNFSESTYHRVAVDHPYCWGRAATRCQRSAIGPGHPAGLCCERFIRSQKES